jgi:hypothetical protein
MPAYKNKFKSPSHIEEVIVDDSGTIGTIRIKPVSILWKPSSERKFFRVSLIKFNDWITSKASGATRTKS